MKTAILPASATWPWIIPASQSNNQVTSRPATYLDQSEVGVRLIASVDGDVALPLPFEVRELEPVLQDELAGLEGGWDASRPDSLLLGALCQPLDRVYDGAAAAHSHHAGLGRHVVVHRGAGGARLGRLHQLRHGGGAVAHCGPGQQHQP